MVTWKQLACDRYCIGGNASDNTVLDEVIRTEVPGAARLLSIRDQVSNLLQPMILDEIVTQEARAKLMGAFVAVIHPLRVSIAQKYRAEAEQLNSGGEVRDDYQPRPDYDDPKRQMS